MANPVVTYVLKMKDEASGTLDGVASSASSASSDLGGASAASDDFGLSMAALAAAAVAAAAAVFGIANAASEYVDQTIIMSRQVGISTDTAIAMDAALKATGSSFQATATGVRAFVAKMQDAATGSKEAEEAFARLGIGVTDSAGGLRDMEAVLFDTIDAIGAMSSDTEKAAAAVDLFGGRGAVLIAALGGSSDSIRAWGEEAQRAGLIIDEDAVAASVAMDDALTRLGITVDATTLKLGGEFTPAVVDAVSAMDEAAIASTALAVELAAVGSAETELATGATNLDVFVASIYRALPVLGLLRLGVSEAAESVRDAALDLAGSGKAILAAQSAELAAMLGPAPVAPEPPATGKDKSALKKTKEEAEDVNALLREMGLLADTFTDVGIGINIEAIGKEETAAIGDSLKDTGDALDRFTQANIAATDATNKAAEAAAEEVAVRRETQATAVAAATQFGTGDVGAGISTLASKNPISAIIAAIVNAFEAIGKLGTDAIIERVDEWQNNLLAGIKELPKLIPELIKETLSFGPELLDVLVEAIPDIIMGILEGAMIAADNLLNQMPAKLITEFIPALIESLIIDFVPNLVKGIAEGIKTAAQASPEERQERGGMMALESRWVDEGAIQLAGMMGDVAGFQSGGVVPRTQLALVHQGERIRSRGGSFTQQGRTLGERSGAQGGGGPALHFHSSVMSPDAIPALVREIERVYGSFGRGSSFLFGGG